MLQNAFLFPKWGNDAPFFFFLHIRLHKRIAHILHNGGLACVLQLEDAFNDGELSRSGVAAGKGAPVVDQQARTNDVRAAVHGSGDERHLEKG